MKRTGTSLGSDDVSGSLVADIGSSELESLPEVATVTVFCVVCDNVVIGVTSIILSNDEFSFLSIVKSVTSVPMIDKSLANTGNVI